MRRVDSGIPQWAPEFSALLAHIRGAGSGGAALSVVLTKHTYSDHPLRRGKWTAEEEAYAQLLIEGFKAGTLPLVNGTTLRAFLSRTLNCDPMRISKKFVGADCVGKHMFRRAEGVENFGLWEDLARLEAQFHSRIGQPQSAWAPGALPPTALNNGLGVAAVEADGGYTNDAAAAAAAAAAPLPVSVAPPLPVHAPLPPGPPLGLMAAGLPMPMPPMPPVPAASDSLVAAAARTRQHPPHPRSLRATAAKRREFRRMTSMEDLMLLVKMGVIPEVPKESLSRPLFQCCAGRARCVHADEGGNAAQATAQAAAALSAVRAADPNAADVRLASELAAAAAAVSDAATEQAVAAPPPSPPAAAAGGGRPRAGSGSDVTALAAATAAVYVPGNFSTPSMAEIASSARSPVSKRSLPPGEAAVVPGKSRRV